MSPKECPSGSFPACKSVLNALYWGLMSNYLQLGLGQDDWEKPWVPEIYQESLDNQHRSHANLLWISTDMAKLASHLTVLSKRQASCNAWSDLEVRRLDARACVLLILFVSAWFGRHHLHCPFWFQGELWETMSQLEKLLFAGKACVPAQAVHVNWYILHKVFSFLFWPNVPFKKWVIISSWLNYYF